MRFVGMSGERQNREVGLFATLLETTRCPTNQQNNNLAFKLSLNSKVPGRKCDEHSRVCDVALEMTRPSKFICVFPKMHKTREGLGD